MQENRREYRSKGGCWHRVDRGIGRRGRYRRITGPPCDIGKSGGIRRVAQNRGRSQSRQLKRVAGARTIGQSRTNSAQNTFAPRVDIQTPPRVPDRLDLAPSGPDPRRDRIAPRAPACRAAALDRAGRHRAAAVLQQRSGAAPVLLVVAPGCAGADREARVNGVRMSAMQSNSL